MPSERIGENIYRLHGDIPLEEVPWYEDVYTLEHFLFWLVQREKVPKNIAYFIGHAIEWSDEFANYLLWTGQMA